MLPALAVAAGGAAWRSPTRPIWLQGNDFFISGESFAGVYVPLISQVRGWSCLPEWSVLFCCIMWPACALGHTQARSPETAMPPGLAFAASPA